MAFDQELKKNITRAFFLPAMLFILLWCIKGFEFISGISFANFGILPHKPEGLPGIILAPLIHADLNHLFYNSISLLVLMTTIFYFYRPLAFKIVILIWLVTGFCVWLGGRKAYHIGASGLVYGFAAFLFFSGVWRRNIKLLAISLMVIFLYGGLIWGIFPFVPEMSWESHLFGGLTGTIFAFLFANEGTQKEEKTWEEEEDDPNELPYWKVDEYPEDKPEQKHSSEYPN